MTGFDINNPMVRRPRSYTNVKVPFILFEGERALGDIQLCQPWLMEFFNTFSHFFVRNHEKCLWIYRPF